MRLVVMQLASTVLLAGCVAAATIEPERNEAAEPARDTPATGGRAADPIPAQWPERVLYGPGELQVSGYLQDVATDRFGRAAWDAFLAAPTGIAVASLPGRWATSRAPAVNLLVRTEAGWTGRSGGREAPVPTEAARELDRLLASPALWAEPSRHPEHACPDSGADVILVRHRGRSKTVYQSGGCGTPNQSSRLIATALRERVPE